MHTSCLVLFYTSQSSLLMGTMGSIFTKYLFELTVNTLSAGAEDHAVVCGLQEG